MAMSVIDHPAGMSRTHTMKIEWDLRGIRKNVDLLLKHVPIILRSLYMVELEAHPLLETFICLQAEVEMIADVLILDHSNIQRNDVIRASQDLSERPSKVLRRLLFEATKICLHVRSFVLQRAHHTLNSSIPNPFSIKKYDSGLDWGSGNPETTRLERVNNYIRIAAG